MKKFENKVVWITGASSGIGEGLAKAWARSGARLVLSARREPELERVAFGCEGAKSILLLPLDLEQPQTFPAKVDQVLQQFGKIDYLINNAGIGQRSLAKDTSIDVDRKIMNINYIGTIALTKAVLPNMMVHDLGHIVVNSSLTGKFGAPYRSSYAASKHALHGFFDTLRAELAETSIKITIICAGYIQTELSKRALLGDGTQQGYIDKAFESGMKVDTFAKKVLKIVAKEKREAWIGPKSYAVYIKRFFPGFFAKQIAKANVR